MFSLEVIWRAGSAYAFARGEGDVFTDAGLLAGEPAAFDALEHEFDARRLTVGELIELAAGPPGELALGDSARGLFALVELAQRSVAEGMVHPQLARGGGSWYAFWGSTVDEHIQRSLDEIAAALPLVSAEGFHDDRGLTVGDLFPALVDQIARDKLVAAGVRLGDVARTRRTAIDSFLLALTDPDPELPQSTSYAALERRLSQWVDAGLSEPKDTTWLVGLHLDERPANGLALELWLHADDDPSLALPVSLLWEGGEDGFSFVRGGDPVGDLEEQLEELRPLLATEGIEFDEVEPTDAELDAESASYFLRELMPQLEQRNVPVLLPEAWLRTPTRLRANMTATSERTASGLLSSSMLASFDWRLAVGDSELTDEQLRALAAAKSPVVQVDGRWQALRPADVKRALRFLERRRQGVGFVDLVRAVSGLETDEAGLELGSVNLDRSLDELLSGKDARFRPRKTPAGMRHQLFPFQEKGHGWLRMLGDLGIGAILADDMGLGKTVQAIAMLVSEREEHGVDAYGPTLVVCPMSVARQWVAEVERFAPGLRVHLHHGSDRLANEELVRRVGEVDVVVTSYDIATRDVDALAEVKWDRLLLDEAQDVKNPATKRARALRTLSARRRVAMTGTPI